MPLPFEGPESLAALRASAPQAGGVHVEGLMLKRKSSPYIAGRPQGQWYKWKRDPLLVDAVLMYAQRGSGKRSSFYSDYTFGLWREGELLPVGKAYFGFTDEELRLLDRWVRNNTTNRFGPVREVEKGAGVRGRVRQRACLDTAQIGRRDALPPHQPHPLGQARR